MAQWEASLLALSTAELHTKQTVSTKHETPFVSWLYKSCLCRHKQSRREVSKVQSKTQCQATHDVNRTELEEGPREAHLVLGAAVVLLLHLNTFTFHEVINVLTTTCHCLAFVPVSDHRLGVAQRCILLRADAWLWIHWLAGALVGSTRSKGLCTIRQASRSTAERALGAAVFKYGGLINNVAGFLALLLTCEVVLGATAATVAELLALSGLLNERPARNCCPAVANHLWLLGTGVALHKHCDFVRKEGKKKNKRTL